VTVHWFHVLLDSFFAVLDFDLWWYFFLSWGPLLIYILLFLFSVGQATVSWGLISSLFPTEGSHRSPYSCGFGLSIWVLSTSLSNNTNSWFYTRCESQCRNSEHAKFIYFIAIDWFPDSRELIPLGWREIQSNLALMCLSSGCY
jgi:hypothetical protein